MFDYIRPYKKQFNLSKGNLTIFVSSTLIARLILIIVNGHIFSIFLHYFHKF